VKKLRLVPLVALAALVVGVVAARADIPTSECNGIQNCERAQGPWVIVPKHGWALYLLNCPGRRGIAGGVEAIATSTDVHVSWDAKPGSPVAPGRSTQQFVFYRAISGKHRLGAFQPRAGCIPTGPTAQTYAFVVQAATVPGAPLNLAATNLKLRPGTVGKTRIGCVPSQTLVDSWTAVAFRTADAPSLALAQAVQVKKTVQGKNVAVTIAVSEALPRGTGIEVQLGVMCAQ
jgi:hypothetical protein